MMDLFVLRHAIAVPHFTKGYENDSERPLTPKGAKKMQRIAKGMKQLELAFDVILTSPFPRANQTAEIVAKEFGMRVRLSDHLAVGGDLERLIEEITKYHPEKNLMVVGHEPSLSRLISILVSGDGDLDITMKKGGLCKLSIDQLHYGRCATLDWLLAPRQLVRIK